MHSREHRFILPVLLAGLVLSAVPAHAMQMATGSYTGNGATYPVAGIGFAPDIVIIKGSGGTGSVLRTKLMTPTLAKPMGIASGLGGGMISSLDANGFTVGPGAAVNKAGERYDWIAFASDGTTLKLGTYTGNGGSPRSLALPFKPSYMMVAGEGATDVVQRFATQSGDASLAVGPGSLLTGRIISLDAAGFTVGSTADVNATGTTYHYIAFSSASNVVSVGSYLGSVLPHNVTGAGFTPSTVILKGDNTSTDTIFRTASWETSISAALGPGYFFNNGIESMLSDGFQIGSDPNVNTALGNYHWLAITDPGSADLSVTVAASDSTPDYGTMVTLFVSVANSGPGTATGLVVNDLLPAGLEYASHVITRGTYDNLSGDWNIGTLSNGETVWLSITAKVTAIGDITNTAAITLSGLPDPNDANNTASVLLTALGARFRVMSGSFTGNGVSYSVTGLDFAPDVVIVKSGSGSTGLIRTATMSGSKELGTNNSPHPNAIVSFDVDGFTVGNNPIANGSGSTIEWIAFRSGDGVSGIGTYLGDGTDNRSIGGLGFEPGFLIVVDEAGEQATMRFSDEAADQCFRFDGTSELTDRIQNFEVDGFQIGSNNDVNRVSGKYNWVAFSKSPNQVNDATYNGNGADNHSISGVGFAPGVVMIKGQDGVDAAMRSSTMPPDLTLPPNAGLPYPDGIQTMEADGFQIGRRAEVNASSWKFYYVAFRDFEVADFSIAKSVSDPAPNEGDLITYQIDMVNDGATTPSAIVVSDLLPGGLSFVSATASQGTYDNVAGLWQVGSLAPAQQATLNVSATVDVGMRGSLITNVATILSSDKQLIATSPNSASVDIIVQSADVGLAASFAPASTMPDRTVSFDVSAVNNGPDGVDSLRVGTTSDPKLTWVATNATQGTFDTLTGAWLVGAIAPGDTARLTLDYYVEPTAAGMTLAASAQTAGANQGDPVAGNNLAGAQLQVFTPVAFNDEPGTLYPSTAVAGQGGVVLRIGVNNTSPIAATLDTTTTISFTDGSAAFSAQLANVTLLPSGAADFTLTFRPGQIPATMTPETSYPVTLVLRGTTEEGAVFADTLVTTGTNEITIEQDKVFLSADILGPATVNPGGTNTLLLSFEVQNGYGSTRTLDTLVVSNASAGPGTQAQIDAETPALRLYADSNDDDAFDASDALVAQATWNAGIARFDVGGSWSIAGNESKHLFVVADVDSSNAADGDAIDVAIVSGANVVFVEPTVVDESITPLYPVNSFGITRIDGMVAHQLSLTASAVDTLFSGAVDQLIASFVIPRNGYMDDTLMQFAVADFSGGINPTDFIAMKLYIDDGDGVFDAAMDPLAGNMAWSGDRYQITGLNLPLTASNMVHLATDVALTPTTGTTFRPGIPVDGVVVASGNDGPIDAPVVCTKDRTIIAVEKIHVASQPIAASTVNPGERDVEILRVNVSNSTLHSTSIDSLVLNNISVGSGTQAQLDAQIGTADVYLDNGNGVVDGLDTQVAGPLAFASGALTAPIGLGLAAGETARLLVAVNVDSTCASDNDSLAVALNGAASLYFGTADAIDALFPIVTPTALDIDGLVAHQIGITPALDSLVVTSVNDNLVLDFTLPGNGYRPDTLQALSIVNRGTADIEHINRVALYADGGDGVFDAGAADDSYLGDFTLVSAKRYTLSFLSVPLPGSCASKRFFAAVDLNTSLSSGASMQFAIPVSGVEVSSGNDGPIDAEVANPSVLLIPQPDELTIFPYAVGDRVSYPGSTNNLNFGVGFYNGFLKTVYVQGITLGQVGDATASELTKVTAWADADSNGLFNPLIDVPLSSPTAVASEYTFDGFNLKLMPQRITYLFVSYDLSLDTRDGAAVNFVLSEESDLVFDPPSTKIGNFITVDSPGIDVTDGSVFAQFDVATAPSYRAAPGETDVLGLSATLPANGRVDDMLNFMSIENTGTALAGTDLTQLTLWADINNNNRFDVPGDSVLAPLLWSGGVWKNAAAIAYSLPHRGAHVFVTANTSIGATDDATIRLAIPLNGMQVASGNDGPIDNTIVNAQEQTISTDPLLTSIEVDRASYSIGQTVVVSMLARNVGTSSMSGVHPSAPTLSGGAGAVVVSGPVPATATIAAGDDATFTWTYTATATGDLSFCGRAFSADSSDVSYETCSPVASVQTPPAPVVTVLTDFTPVGVNVGQHNVRTLTLSLSHDDYDSTSADVLFDGIDITLLDGVSPIAPNTALDGLTLISSSGSNYQFDLADSTTNPLHLRLSEPVAIAPGGSVDLDVNVDIAPDATAPHVALSLAWPSDIRVFDANTLQPVGIATAATFPWATGTMEVSVPADTLVIASADTMTRTINHGQTNVPCLDLDLRHPGPANAADIIVTSVTLTFQDSAGTGIVPRDAIAALSIRANSTLIFNTDVIPVSGTAITCPLSTPILLSGGDTRTMHVSVDARLFPDVDAFAVCVNSAGAISARDNNSNTPVAVAATPTFPERGATLVFQPEATGLIVSSSSLAPETILPDDAGVPLLQLEFTHADTSVASDIAVDSLAVEFTDALGSAILPGDYFTSLAVTSGADTIALLSSLSAISPVAQVRFTTPVVLTPQSIDSIRVLVTARSVYTPTEFRVRVEQSYIHAVDQNSGQRVLGVAGAFPILSGACALVLPGADVAASVASTLPTNVTGTEAGLGAFTLTARNNAGAGFTPVELRGVTVSTEDWTGAGLDPGAIVSSARLVYADTISVVGIVTPAGIEFTIAPGLIRIAPGASAAIALKVDLATAAGNETFRFAIQDNVSLSLVDAATGTPITVPASAFPMVTDYAHVLGSDPVASFTNYPNPFAAGRDETSITFFLESAANVKLRLFTLWGAPVATLIDGREPAGLRFKEWNGVNDSGDVVNNGVYYLLLQVDGDDGNSYEIKRKVGVVR